MSIQSELKNLFPKHIIRQATRLEPEKVDALAVNKAAGALLHLKGKPTEQVALVLDQPAQYKAHWRFLRVIGNGGKHARALEKALELEVAPTFIEAAAVNLGKRLGVAAPDRMDMIIVIHH